MTDTCYRINFASELHSMRNILRRVISYISINYPFITDDDIFDLRLIYSELLTNAILHGNKNDLTKSVNISIEVVSNAIWSEIIDEGNGFNYLKILEEENFQRDLLYEKGRGIKIVQSLTSSLKFNNNGNSVKFCKKFLSQQSDRNNSVLCQIALIG